MGVRGDVGSLPLPTITFIGTWFMGVYGLLSYLCCLSQINQHFCGGRRNITSPIFFLCLLLFLIKPICASQGKI